MKNNNLIKTILFTILLISIVKPALATYEEAQNKLAMYLQSDLANLASNLQSVDPRIKVTESSSEQLSKSIEMEFPGDYKLSKIKINYQVSAISYIHYTYKNQNINNAKSFYLDQVEKTEQLFLKQFNELSPQEVSELVLYLRALSEFTRSFVVILANSSNFKTSSQYEFIRALSTKAGFIDHKMKGLVNLGLNSVVTETLLKEYLKQEKYSEVKLCKNI